MIAETISKISYKPGWEFSTEHYAHRNVLIIEATVPHSTTLKMVRFQIRRIIPEVITTKEILLSWIKDELIEAEVHELREFLRYDGALVDDPHKSELV